MSDETDATGERRRRWRLGSVARASSGRPERPQQQLEIGCKISNLASRRSPLAMRTCWLTLGHPKAATGHPERADRRRCCATANFVEFVPRRRWRTFKNRCVYFERQRRFPGTTLMMHGAPALVLAQHLGRNLRFKGSPLCDRPRSNSCRHQCRSGQAPSEHARPVLGQRTMEFTS
jgi:hypothetical protein